MTNLPSVDQDRLVRTLLDLVAIDSPSRHEGPAVAYVRTALARLGLDSTVDEVQNVYAHLPARGPDRDVLLLNAHVDTVQPTAGIRATVEGGTVRTDGRTILGADDKAAVAAILEALAILRASDLPHAGLDILFTVQEELGLEGAKRVDFSRLTARMGICPDVDGPPHRLVLAAPGHNHLGAVFHGQAAHSGMAPERGRSAIAAAAQAIARMALGRIDAETTANIGTIGGGQARNIVPDRCEILGEARSRDEGKLRRQTEAMATALREAADRSGCTLDLTVRSAYRAYRHDPDAPIVQRTVGAVRALGRTPIFGETGAGADASIFNEHGIATLLIGVGYQDIHTTGEHIAVSDVVDLARTLLAVAVGARPE